MIQKGETFRIIPDPVRHTGPYLCTVKAEGPWSYESDEGKHAIVVRDDVRVAIPWDMATFVDLPRLATPSVPDTNPL